MNIYAAPINQVIELCRALHLESSTAGKDAYELGLEHGVTFGTTETPEASREFENLCHAINYMSAIRAEYGLRPFNELVAGLRTGWNRALGNTEQIS